MPEPIEAFDPSQLADIYLPEAVTFWPPAPGWWLLLALIITVIIFIIYLIKRQPKKPLPTGKQLKSQALQELNSIKEYYQAQKNESHTNHEITHETIKKLSVFLRRYALSLYQRDSVASLTNEQWLALLDKISDTTDKPFSHKFAILITQTPYQSAHKPVDTQLLSELFSASEEMINKSFKEFKAKPSIQGNKTHV